MGNNFASVCFVLFWTGSFIQRRRGKL